MVYYRGMPRFEYVVRVLPAEPAGEWRPVAAATRDGTPIMTRLDLHDGPRPLRWEAWDGPSDPLSDGSWLDLDGTLTGSVVGEADPTEWRPLTDQEREALTEIE